MIVLCLAMEEMREGYKTKCRRSQEIYIGCDMAIYIYTCICMLVYIT